MNKFYFNNNCNTDLNLIVTSPIIIPISTEEVEEVEVEGRNGYLTIPKNIYKDKVIPIDLFLLESSDVYNKIEVIDNWLTDIVDNKLLINDRDKAYVVKRVVKGEFARDLIAGGSFTINFVCEPFLILPYEQSINFIDNFNYLGNIPGEPIIKIWGNGNIQLEINGEVIQIKNVVNYVEVDSKYMTVRDSKGESKNLDFIGDFPLLQRGINTIKKIGSITKVEMLPRTYFRN